MIHHLRGRLTEKTPTHAIIECGGVGYLLHITLNTAQRLPNDESCMLLVHEVIREDAHELYGFLEEGEREAFRRLVSVSGVGANTARMILSSLTPADLVNVILSKDVDSLKGIKGIGAKTAQRIIVDLHDKFPAGDLGIEKIAPGDNTVKIEALTALSSLGFDRTKAEKTLDKILKTEGSSISVEELIKLALKQL
ncbi:MAG: Holliday junction branch migration protein RuvA [Flavobacteriales bacterium]|nr:Holliday junction branch migration protein RuvA [Flavobacteriales bacterium]